MALDYPLDQLECESRVEPDPPPARKYPWRPAVELWNKPPPPQVIRGLLVDASLNIIYGAPKTGKTFLVMDMVVQATKGNSRFAERFEIGEPMTCGYATSEGRAYITARHRAACALHGHSGEGLHVLRTVPNLMSEEEAKRFVEDTLSVGVPMHIIVFDTLRNTLQGGDENAQKDASVVTANVRLIQAKLGDAWGFEPVIVLVHHANKGGGLSGSTVWSGEADAVIKVTNAGGLRTFEGEMFKDLPEFGKLAFRLEPSSDSMVVKHTGPLQDGVNGGPTRTRDRVERAMLTHAFGRENAKTVRNLLPFIEGDASRARVANLLTELRESATSAVEGFEGKQGWHYYIED